MHLMMFLDDSGKRVYTLKKIDLSSAPTTSAHPGIITVMKIINIILIITIIINSQSSPLFPR